MSLFLRRKLLTFKLDQEISVVPSLWVRGKWISSVHNLESNEGLRQDYMVTPVHCNVVTAQRLPWNLRSTRPSDMASALVRNQMCTCLRLIKLICAIIICSSIRRVSSDSHLSDKAKIAFRTMGHQFRRPLLQFCAQPVVMSLFGPWICPSICYKPINMLPKLHFFFHIFYLESYQMCIILIPLVCLFTDGGE